MIYRKITKKRLLSSCGQSVTELAIIVPVLALVLVGITDFARVFYTGIEVYNSARSGVQAGASSSTYTNTSAMTAAATSDANGLSMVSGYPTATYYCQCGTTSATCPPTSCASDPRIYVKVTTEATFTTMLHYPGVPHSTTLSSTAIMRAE
jgi:Flp pilus assembly protein TadG